MTTTIHSEATKERSKAKQIEGKVNERLEDYCSWKC